jgi:hypothetical protein
MKTVKALLGLAVLVGVVLFLVGVAPPYFANYQFKDDVVQAARFANVSNPPKTDEDIRNDLMRKAKEYDIPIKSEQIQINRQGSDILISIPYTVDVKFLTGQTYRMEFNPGNSPAARQKNN